MIDIHHFAELDIRVGTVLSVEKVANSKKLYELVIDVGSDIRHILTGMGPHIELEAFLGKQVLVICNLEPRQMAGRISEGMMLSTYDPKGKPVLISPTQPVVPGTKVK